MQVVEDAQPRAEPREEITLEPRPTARTRFVLIMLLGIAGYLYLNLFLLPRTPILLSGDQVFFWVNGQRMLHGERPYLDFFQFTPPGADVFYFSLFKLFGPRIWVLNVAVLALGVGLCWVCFILANHIMERHLALLSVLLFLTLIYTRLLNATHHCFSVLAVMGAIAILMRETNSTRLVLAGALLGLASFFTQTHGVAALVGITCLLAWEQHGIDGSWRTFWKREGELLMGFAIVLLILSAPFLASVGVKQLWYFQITYVAKAMVHLPETHLLGMPQYANWRAMSALSLIGEYSRHIFVYVMLPVVYLITLLRCRPNLLSSRPVTRKVALLGLVGAALLGELVFSLNWLRLYAVSMAGIILFVWILSASALRRYGIGAAWVLVVGLGISQPWLIQHRGYLSLDLPAGRSAVDRAEYEKLSWGVEHTKPGDFFFQATWPGMYLPLGLRNPVFLDTASTMLDPRWSKQAVQQLEAKQVRYVLWAPRLDYPVDRRRPRTANIVPLRTYLHTQYRLATVFQDGDEVWERK